MRPGTLELDGMLRALCGTGVLRDYCRSRAIPIEIDDKETMTILDRWERAVSNLPPARQAEVELELAQVRALSNRRSIYHLIDVCAGKGLPSELLPGEPAQAVWFLLHQPSVFREVYFHEEVAETESWIHAQVTGGLDLSDHDARRPAFEAELRRFHNAEEGTGRYCTVQSYRFEEPIRIVFLGHVSAHPRWLSVFAEDGERRRERIRPARPVIFAYYPDDGTILLKCRQRAREKVLALLRGFSRVVLDIELDERGLRSCFALDRLIQPFDPILPEGIALARVKSLDLAYPPSEGRRQLRLETHGADRTTAIAELLEKHVDRETRGKLRVVSAELLVALPERGRLRHHTIRLWPDRCTLSQTETSEFLRRCLRTWGLLRHAPQP